LHWLIAACLFAAGIDLWARKRRMANHQYADTSLRGDALIVRWLRE